jgi:hypothetical protein
MLTRLGVISNAIVEKKNPQYRYTLVEQIASSGGDTSSPQEYEKSHLWHYSSSDIITVSATAGSSH